MPEPFNDPITAQVAAFLTEIGIPVTTGDVPDDTFLPGVLVESGGLVIDEAKLLYPGDLLHEAGHLAFAPAAIRSELNGEVVIPGANPDVVETQAICWSFAACIHLGIEPEIVFHENGYHGRSGAILQNFRFGIYIGLPGLETNGMAFSPKNADEKGTKPYPVMQKWLAD